VADKKKSRLEQLDLGLRLSRDQEQERLTAAQRRLLALRLQLGGKLGDGRLGPPVCVLFEGWDAAGKGGAIKRLVAPLDLRHVRVATFAAPTPDEKRHQFLLRFASCLPGWGGMSVLDRSWYGRVLVERVEGYATVDEWSRAYEEIVEFERMNAREGMIIVKYWLHISSEEQLKRFKRREQDPLKRWRVETLRAREGNRDDDRGDREGDARARFRADRTAHPPSHCLISGGALRCEKSPWSRIRAAASAIAPTATQVSQPPRLTRFPPAAVISLIDSLGCASTFTGFETLSQTARISSTLRRPGAYSTSAPAFS